MRRRLHTGSTRDEVEAGESGGPEGQGRNSKPDEEQKSPAAQPAAGVLMPGSLKLEDGADRPVPGRPPPAS